MIEPEGLTERRSVVTIVIVLNCLIALICWIAVWQMVKLRRKLASIANKIAAAERSTYAVLHRAPNAIIKGQRGIYQLRRQYQSLDPQLQQLQKMMALLRLGQAFWRWRLPNRKGRSTSRGQRQWNPTSRMQPW